MGRLYPAQRTRITQKKHKKKREMTYGSEAVGNLIADNVDSTVSGNSDNRLQVSEINTYLR